MNIPFTLIKQSKITDANLRKNKHKRKKKVQIILLSIKITVFLQYNYITDTN